MPRGLELSLLMLLLSACSPPAPEVLALSLRLPALATDASPLRLYVGQSQQLNATVQLANGELSQALSWRSLQPELLAVSDTGVARGLKAGLAEVLVQSQQDPSQQAHFRVEIREPLPENLESETVVLRAPD